MDKKSIDKVDVFLNGLLDNVQSQAQEKLDEGFELAQNGFDQGLEIAQGAIDKLVGVLKDKAPDQAEKPVQNNNRELLVQYYKSKGSVYALHQFSNPAETSDALVDREIRFLDQYRPGWRNS